MFKMFPPLLSIGVVLASSVLLGGCLPQHKLANSANQDMSTVEQKEKVGDTTLTGKISQIGDKYFITVGVSQPEEIDSYSVKLDQYVGKIVTVTGQYSGDTLFVGKIQ